MKIECSHKFGKSYDGAVVNRDDNIFCPQAGGFCRSVGIDVGNNRSPTSRQAQACRQRGSDVLRCRANSDSLHMSVFPKPLIVKLNNLGWDRKTEPFAAATFAENHSIDSNYIAVHIEQRTAAVSWIERGVSLDVHHR